MKNVLKKKPVKATKDKIDVFKTICLIMRIGILCMSVFVILMFSAMYMIPLVTATFGGSAGITYDSHYIDVLTFMILPSLFFIAMLFTADVALIKWLHRALKNVFQKILQKRDEMKTL